MTIHLVLLLVPQRLGRQNFGRLGHNPPHNAVALAQFDDFASFQLGQKLTSIPELAKIHARHEYNVTHDVTHCQTESLFVPQSLGG